MSNLPQHPMPTQQYATMSFRSIWEFCAAISDDLVQAKKNAAIHHNIITFKTAEKQLIQTKAAKLEGELQTINNEIGQSINARVNAEKIIEHHTKILEKVGGLKIIEQIGLRNTEPQMAHQAFRDFLREGNIPWIEEYLQPEPEPPKNPNPHNLTFPIQAAPKVEEMMQEVKL